MHTYKIKYKVTLHYEMKVESKDLPIRIRSDISDMVIDELKEIEFPDLSKSELVWIEQEVKDVVYLG